MKLHEDVVWHVPGCAHACLTVVIALHATAVAGSAAAVLLRCALTSRHLCGDGWYGDCPWLQGSHVPHRRAIPSALGRLRTWHAALA